MTNGGKSVQQPMIMVIDDDVAVRLVAQEALLEGGFRTCEAENGKQALDLISEITPDLLLLDVMMPEMDGFEVCKAIRKNSEYSHLPIVMATALDDFESIQNAYEVGATDFIIKPINWNILRHRIQYILRASSVKKKLTISEERYSLSAKGANDGLWDWDLRSDQVYFSPRWKEMLGYQNHEISTEINEWLDRVHEDDAERVKAELEFHLKGNSSHFESEYRILSCTGEYRWVLCRGLAVPDAHGKRYRMAGSQTDITERKHAEEQLLHDALHDCLTQLPNRALFLERVDHCIQLAKRHHYLFAVMFLDLDRFKNINDSLGHALGDQLLIQIAKRLKQQLRETDTLARLGGDEFTILFDDLPNIPTLTRIAERIQIELAKPYFLDGHEVVSSASIGITLSTTPYVQAGDMLRDADTAMYRAKKLGKDRFVIFDAEMHIQVLTALQTEAELRASIKQQQFCLHYQPIVALENDKIVGFEALLRWQHPTRGMLLPDDFLSIAEETALIIPIDLWVLNEACQQLKTWQKESPSLNKAHISVNVSSRQFSQPGFVSQVQNALDVTGLSAECLKLEVTEHVLINNDQHALETMTRLRDRGIQLSLDDFGTGYSSFNYLHRFPFDVLKIDRGFVKQMDKITNSEEIVKAIIALARNLGLTVVAEGSESLDELEKLKSLECEFGQGFVYSKPLDVMSVSKLILNGFEKPLVPKQDAISSTN